MATSISIRYERVLAVLSGTFESDVLNMKDGPSAGGF